MSYQWIDPASCHSLIVLVESVIAPLLVQHASPVCLEIDIDPELGIPADATAMADLLRSLCRQSLSEMPGGGDLMITACQTERGLELELADTGREIESRPQNLPLVAAALGARLKWQNCPQGGGAVTVTFRSGQAAIRRAA